MFLRLLLLPKSTQKITSQIKKTQNKANKSKLKHLYYILFLDRTSPSLDITLSAGVEVPCTHKYFLAS